jgi:hypothetical protein
MSKTTNSSDNSQGNSQGNHPNSVPDQLNRGNNTKFTDNDDGNMYHRVNVDINADKEKWRGCSIYTQKITSYSFNVGPSGFVSVGGRPEVSPDVRSFSEIESNPLNLINKIS